MGGGIQPPSPPLYTRGFTLFNCDYKLAAKSIANGMKIVLPSIISPDQTGFIKVRLIGENVPLRNSVIRFAKERNIRRAAFIS